MEIICEVLNVIFIRAETITHFMVLYVRVPIFANISFIARDCPMNFRFSLIDSPFFCHILKPIFMVMTSL